MIAHRTCTREPKSVEIVVRSLGSRHILAGNGSFKGFEGTFQCGQFGKRQSFGGKLCAYLSNMGANFVRDWRRLDHHALVQYTLA